MKLADPQDAEGVLLFQLLGAEAAKIIERFEKKKLVKDYADFLKSNAR
jgi:hypothetical protein